MAREDFKVVHDINERTLWEIGGYPPGKCVYRQLDFSSKKQVDEVEAWFQHSVEGYKTITARGIPTLMHKTSTRHHYTVRLRSPIRDSDVPGTYRPYRVYFRFDGKWIALSRKRKALEPFDVIHSGSANCNRTSHHHQFIRRALPIGEPFYLRYMT